MNLRLYDSHNHLQDGRLRPMLGSVVDAIRSEGVIKMVVNGSCEEDWSEVLELARQYPFVIPSFGYHPWYVKERTESWKQTLISYLEQLPSAVGEIGLDRWIPDYDIELQKEMFVWQLRLAAERNLPVSIHCLQAWGMLFDLLREEPRPACGFVLHSYGGPQEMVAPLAKLGAYFSIPGYFAHERKVRHRETFRQVPRDRLLIETDAPDQLLPDDRTTYSLTDQGTGKKINHPANLPAVYRFTAEILDLEVSSLAATIEENFLRLFGAVSALP